MQKTDFVCGEKPCVVIHDGKIQNPWQINRRKSANGSVQGKLRATIMVQKGLYDKVVAIQDYVDVINALAPLDTGNFLYAFLVYMSNFDIFDQETILEITNQLTTEMKTKSKSFIDEFIA